LNLIYQRLSGVILVVISLILSSSLASTENNLYAVNSGSPTTSPSVYPLLKASSSINSSITKNILPEKIKLQYQNKPMLSSSAERSLLEKRLESVNIPGPHFQNNNQSIRGPPIELRSPIIVKNQSVLNGLNSTTIKPVPFSWSL
jgi:hypothetical protein